jgi:hypothetical protein
MFVVGNSLAIVDAIGILASRRYVEQQVAFPGKVQKDAFDLFYEMRESENVWPYRHDLVGV